MRALLLSSLILTAGLAGCATPDTPATTSTPPTSTPTPGAYDAMGFDDTTWPRLDGVTLTILDHGAFGAFSDAKKLFENLTGARLEHIEAKDSGDALSMAIRERGAPTYDILYGVDNILYARAAAADIFEPYRPLLAERIAQEYRFFGNDSTWLATPVDHGYIALNVDANHTTLANKNITTLDDVRDNAATFVTQDPRTSTPGLGFLLATIATYPESAEYSWKNYWNDLFAGGVLITSGWTEAYEQHFSGGYGADYGGAADRAIVTSYTTSPAYEHFFGRSNDALAQVITAPAATFHQIETMGIAKGTKNLAAAQAWIEFTLTDDFQNLTASAMAVYPVVTGVDVSATFGGIDPAPGTFEPASLDATTLGRELEGWVRAWVDLCEAASCA